MKALFVDTAGWMACADGADPAHLRSCAARDAALEAGQTLVTTDFVVDETLTLIRLRLGLVAAEAWWHQVDRSPRLRWERIDSDRFERARQLFFQYRDKEFSFTDCTTQTERWPIASAREPIMRSRAKTAALWIAQVGAAGIFLIAGTSKLAGVAAMVQFFGAIGIGQWFRYVTGAIEVASAVLLLVPTLTFFGALALAVTMVGAIITHLFIVGGNPALAIVLLATTAAIAWMRRSERFRDVCC